MWSRIIVRGLLLATFASTALSGPSSKFRDGDPRRSGSIGVEQALLDDFDLFAQYSAATYWPINSNSTGGPLLCGPGGCPSLPSNNCPQVEEAKAYTTDEFQDTPNGDDSGYIAVDEVNKLVVLAFRGTASKENWKHNWEIEKKHTDFCPKCKVHSGFWDQWTPIREGLIKKVRAAHDDFPDFRLIITGHSLGGAIATLAAADIRKIVDDPWYLANTELFTFGSPRLANKHTARFLSNQSTLSYRVTSLNDPIPHVPFREIGYWHTQPEYWIMHNAEAPRREDIMIVTGYNNRLGNMGHDGYDSKVHNIYFGHVGSCGDEKKK